MDGVHDLGGVQGFGPIPIATGDADFRDIEEWEKRMWGLARSGPAPGITIDWFRHGLERMVPADYLSFAYFNKWCANYLMLMIDNGAITIDDVRRGHVEDPGPPAEAKTVAEVLDITSKGNVSFAVEGDAEPVFALGADVKTRRLMTASHTRLPRYARDAHGTIIAHHGSHLLPEDGARGRHRGEHLYTVSFAAPELWGADANPRDTVSLDLWESYLVSA